MVLFITEFMQLSWNDISTLVLKKKSILSFKDHIRPLHCTVLLKLP